jgi:hypothetical protein
MKPTSLQSLRRFNTIMGFFHLIQALGMTYLYATYDKASNFKIPVFSNFLTFNTTLGRLVTETNTVFTVPFALWVAAFLYLSAIAHFIISIPAGNQIYNRYLGKGMNPFRWYEYALSSSLMIVLIGLLFAIYDIGAILLMFGLNATMNLFGLLMEQMNQNAKKIQWSPFVFGSVAGIIPWIVIVMHTFGNSDLSRVPWFAYAIFGSYFVFFNLFPINMILQYKKIGKWKDYLYGERVYIILSLAAKTVLAWLVFFGIMQPV